MLCALSLMAIDYSRGTRSWAFWACTTNLTGVVVAVIFFSFSNKQEWKNKWIYIYSVACIAALPLGYRWWMLHQERIFRDQLLSAILNVWLLGICLILLAARLWKAKKRENCGIRGLVMGRLASVPKVLLLMEGAAAIMLLWMFFSENEDVWPIWYLILFGILYHAGFSDRDKEALRLGFLDGIILSFFLFQGAAFVFRPFDHEHYRYCGIYSNSNINALFYCIVWTAFLVRLFDIRQKKDKLWKEILCFLFVGAMFGFITLTGAKTALLCCIGIGLIYLIIGDFVMLRKKAGKVVLLLGALGMVALISVPVDYLAVRYLPPLFHHPIWYEGEYSDDRVFSWDPVDSEKYVSFEEYLSMFSGRLSTILQGINGTQESSAGMSRVLAAENDRTKTQKASASGKKKNTRAAKLKKIQEKFGEEFAYVDLNYDPDAEPIYETEFSKRMWAAIDDGSINASYAGRLIMWEFFLKNGTWTGHSSSVGHNFLSRPIRVWHPQNMFLQFWYYYGYPAGTLYLLLNLSLIGLGIRRFFRGNNSALICVLYELLILVYGMTELTWYPAQMILFLAFFTPLFLFADKSGEQSGNPGTSKNLFEVL